MPAECNFAANFQDILQQLQAALKNDPGDEPLTVLAYYNPKNGLEDEADFDRKLLGANGAGQPVRHRVGRRPERRDRPDGGGAGIPVADAYPAFKEAGQTFILPDKIHPTAEGHAAIAQAFREAKVQPIPSCAPDSVDEKAPQTKVTRKVKLNKRSVKFVFRSSEKGSKFQCSLDGKRFSRCRSPKKLKRLKKGKHIFRVRAIDKAGNVDRTPAKRKFRIKR